MTQDSGLTTPIGIAGMGMYAPPEVVTAEMLAVETGIPPQVLRDKFGVRQVHRAGPDCHVSQMAAAAGQAAIEDAEVSPDEVDLVVSCGSEYKDYIVWSAATKVAHDLGCTRAQAFEVYALCAGMPVTLRIVGDMMRAEPELRTVLIVAASKESELVDRQRERTRFMFNFGDGASAAVLRRGLNRNVLLASDSMVDGSLSEAAVMLAGGSRRPPTAETVAAGQHYLDVPDIDQLRDRLDEVSGPNFLRVVGNALRKSGRANQVNSGHQVGFLAAVHMKRSMHVWLVDALHAERSFYLDEYGHMQAADQFVAIVEGRQRGLLHDGDVVVLAAAGVGYTWAATVVDWGTRGSQ
jgi:3-oxoacyl-[acyl-carrier-protein] synthase-3